MKKSIWFIIILFGLLPEMAFGQEELIRIQVLDSVFNSGLAEVIVSDASGNQYLGMTDEKGLVRIPSRFMPNSIRFHLFGYHDVVLDTRSFVSNGENRVFMQVERQILYDVEIEGDRFPRELLVSQFERWERGFIAISKYYREVYVLDEFLTPVYQFDLPGRGNGRYKTLFKDVQGNHYLLSKDSCIQLFITDTMTYLFPGRSLVDFNRYIRNLKLVAPNGDRVYRNLEPVRYQWNTVDADTGEYFNMKITYPRFHNCGAEFTAYQRGVGSKVVYFTLDTSAYDAADQEFQLYLRWYAFAKGSPLVREWGLRLHSYKTLFGPYREIPLFNYHGMIVIFDPFRDRIVHLDRHYEPKHSYPFDLSKTSSDFVALQDESSMEIWLFYRKRGLDHLILLEDAAWLTDQKIYVDTFIRNVRINDGVCYFLNDEYQISVKKLR